MRIGVPGGLLFFTYEQEVRAFFDTLQAEWPVLIRYSAETSQEILDLGVETCVDEACVPIKVFCGHAAKLAETCDAVVVPRLLRREDGASICPKFAGLPELAARACGEKRMLFTQPMDLCNPKDLLRGLVREGRSVGFPGKTIEKAFSAAKEARMRKRLEAAGRFPLFLSGEKLRILLLGHPYHLRDAFLNRGIVGKLERAGAVVAFEDEFDPGTVRPVWEDWMKKPYWGFLRDNCQAAYTAARKRNAAAPGSCENGGNGDSVGFDGVIYLSSFGCGTDSFTLEFVKRSLGELPFLVVKLDEQTGEAGLDTRLEAFCELLERRRAYAVDISASGRGASVRTSAI